MNEELKPSRWRYVPSIFAALSVAGCVVYFNLAHWEYPYFVIAWDYGWPLLCRHQSYTFIGGNIPDTLSRDTIYYGALAANIAIGVVMTVLAAWGVNHLQKINRSLFRIHLQTIVLLVLAIGALMLLNTRVREYTLRPRDIAAYGWPYYAVATWNNSWNQCSLNIAKNAFVALYILFLVTLASETWLAWRSAKVNKRTTIMNQAKDFPDRYWPRIFATAFVCVCLLIFNFRQSNDSTEYIFDYSYGWPFRTYTVVNDIFSIRDLGIGTVFWSFSGLFLNLGICFSLLFLTPLGVRQLQRVNGGLCRFHLQTVLIIVLLMGLFLKLNLIQSINQQIWPWGGTANHSGWPYRALYWDTSTDNPGNSVPMIFWGALAKNAFVAGYACFLAWVLSESWLAWRARKKSNQTPV